jgi:hypothetical protein
MARLGPANSRRSRRFGDFLRRAAGFESEQVTTIDGHRIDVRSAQLLPTNGAAQAYEALAMTRAAVTPPMPYPGYLPVTDAALRRRSRA